jgi:predicted amidophosphoribosyltransferase
MSKGFQIQCLCGKHIQSLERTTVCPDCGRELRIDWPAPVPEAKAKPTISEKYEK